MDAVAFQWYLSNVRNCCIQYTYSLKNMTVLNLKSYPIFKTLYVLNYLFDTPNDVIIFLCFLEF